MSFSPLPPGLATDLQGDGAVVDLGCGEGRLLERLRRLNGRALGLDRRGPRLGTAADIVADAGCLPLRPGSCRLLVAGNLLRAITGRGRRPAPLREWLRCLVPGGYLYLLEDEPSADTPAQRHYRDLQALLAEFVPGREPLWPWREARRYLAEQLCGIEWRGGLVRNRQRPPSPGAILAWLVPPGTAPTGLAARLARRIAADGLDYGSYWWCRVVAPGGGGS